MSVALLERSISYALDRVREVAPADLTNPTPCPDWDLRALLRHTGDSLAALIEGGARGRIGLDVPVSDPSLEVRGRAAAVLAAWSRPVTWRAIAIGDAALPPAVVAVAGALEIAVHGWDIAQACGRPRPIPAALAADLLPLCPLLVTGPGRAPMFGPAVPVPDGSGPSDRLVALLGRRPGQARVTAMS
ncbi:MAG: TIGR03086 family metal-binding protein [Mycobacteriales bacterium]